jgi:hypothetical protein
MAIIPTRIAIIEVEIEVGVEVRGSRRSRRRAYSSSW